MKARRNKSLIIAAGVAMFALVIGCGNQNDEGPTTEQATESQASSLPSSEPESPAKNSNEQAETPDQPEPAQAKQPEDGRTLHQKIVGRWEFDVEASEVPEKVPRERFAKAMAKRAMSFTETETTNHIGRRNFTSNYEVLSQEGQTLTLRTTTKRGRTDDATFTFRDDDTIEFDVDNMKMILKRAADTPENADAGSQQ